VDAEALSTTINMESQMPEVQTLVQEFAHPLGRLDWRTCKAFEADAITAYYACLNPLFYDDLDELYDTLND
jgi:hypothetical protein